jgi:hypothetical protein
METNMKRILMLTAALALTVPGAVLAQTPKQEAAAAMARLDFMRGVWVGPASGANPGGGTYAVTQTERIGPLLDGTIMVVEGRGYNADGSTGFNAFGVISWNGENDRYEFRSYTDGHSGTFPMTVTENGYVWEVPAGPGVMRFTADVTATTYHEVGDFVMPGQPPRRSFEMTLTRRGDSDWPGAGAVTP